MSIPLSRAKNPSKYKNYIKEVKTRLLYVVLSFVCVFLIAYNNALQLMHIFLLSFPQPDFEKRFIFTDLHEGFSSILYICFVTGLLCILPLIAYQFVSYFSPSWHKQERKSKSRVILFCLFLGGSVFCVLHLYLIPGISSFLLRFQVTNTCLTIQAKVKIIEYLYWSSALLLYISIFLFLLLIVFLTASRFLCIHKTHKLLSNRSTWVRDDVYYTRVLVGDHSLVNYRQFFFFVSFLFIAFISPPDIVYQLGIFLCLYLLFEILLWGVLVRCCITENTRSL